MRAAMSEYNAWSPGHRPDPAGGGATGAGGTGVLAVPHATTDEAELRPNPLSISARGAADVVPAPEERHPADHGHSMDIHLFLKLGASGRGRRAGPGGPPGVHVQAASVSPGVPFRALLRSPSRRDRLPTLGQ